MELQGLIPINRLVKQESKEELEIMIGRKLPSYNTAKDFAARLQTDPKYFYIDTYDIWSPIVFVNGFMYLDLKDFSQERLEQFIENSAFNDYVLLYNNKLKEKDLVWLFNLIEQRIRIPRFIEYFDKLPDNQKFKVFRSIYTQVEFGFQDLKYYVDRVKEFRPRVDKRRLGKNIDKDGFVVIYRGIGTKSTPVF